MPPKKGTTGKKGTLGKKAAPSAKKKSGEAIAGNDVKAPPTPEDDHASTPARAEETRSPDDKKKPGANARKPSAPEPPQDGGGATGRKRKAPGASGAKPSKAPREGSRKSSRGDVKAPPSQLQLLRFLISQEADDLCRPDDEKDFLGENPHARTYGSSVLNPFEELLCAVVLSRPISHRLGLRSIRTLLNEPYGFTSAKKTRDAGEEKRRQAFWDARTQHKEKTADQVGMVADVVLDKYCDESDGAGENLAHVLAEADGDVGQVLDTLKKDLKGFGKTSMGIFKRRIQWIWEGAFPYVDGRTGDGLKALGLPEHAEELEAAVQKHWKQLHTANIAGDDEAAKKRRAFVLILERATGASLEGKTNEVLRAAVSV
ncbi:hypothetical protein F5Y15DRAFT_24705 [Xylariaceae sp. FL0016]|nr:hypothetical protein F5Y15DRAFT_24705 [Xylariaceae sp. FL0016]